MIKALPLILAIHLLTAARLAAQTDKETKIVQHEAPGNLEVTHNLDCIGIDGIQADYTPADLYPAVTKCLIAGELNKATETFVVAGVFGRFDKKRVTDESAHQAMTMLLQSVFNGVSEDKKSEFQEVMRNRFGGEKIDESICPRLRSLGHPTYYPRYMIQHGMSAFLPDASEKPLVEGFKADEAWGAILKDSVGCP